MKKISFSQYSVWKSCQWKFKLNYIDNVSMFKPNIHLLFGSALHKVLQSYLTLFYISTEKKANELNLNKMLLDEMKINFDKYISDGYINFTNKDEMVEFYIDGVEILKFFKKNKSLYFPKKNHKLVGCEILLDYKIKDELYFIGYIDIVIKDIINNKVIIFDFKKSRNGWKKDKELKDDIKKSQLQLYKYFYSKQEKIPIDNINIEFLILKQKVFDNKMGYKISRIQRFEPPSGNITINKVIKDFNEFVNSSFTTDSYNKDGIFKKIPDAYKCKYCEFNTICDKNGENY